MELHGLDTDTEVFFYEQDFYVLSNFSAFNLCWKSRIFCTAEAAYHFEKFDYGEENTDAWGVALDIYIAPSAHDAFKIAEQNKALRRPDWDAVKVGIMHSILRAKADQHEYVRRKLLATGYRYTVSAMISRRERPEAIISQILLGVTHDGSATVQSDRAQAIAQIVNDSYIVGRAGNLNLTIGSKPYLQEAPLGRFPQKAAFSVDGALAEHDFLDIGEPYRLHR